MNNCTFVILGATGDLTKRKLIPAIYRLMKEKKIDKCAFIGVARPEMSAEEVLASGKKFIQQKVDERVWKRLIRCSYYYALDFYVPNDFLRLKKELLRIEKKHNLVGNRLFYLATMPQHFKSITKYLSWSGIVKEKRPLRSKRAQSRWSRIVYEKPFGYDIASARAINRCISALFNEQQIYRIDHYLGKELVGNIELVRFTNRVLEPLWNRDNIESVQIIMKEKEGVDGRGEYFDSVGTLRDVVQNHILQLVSLVGMESPSELSALPIRDAKVRVLKKVRIDSVITGQYDGYGKEKDVHPHSKTETFVALKLYIDNKRWKNVPFYIKTGKSLDVKETSIHVRFKHVPCLLLSCPSEPNYLTFKIQPDEGFFLEINAKLPGKNEVVPVKMDFCHKCLFGPNTPASYENLLFDVIRGDQSVFIRSDEIMQSWKIIEQIWQKKPIMYRYKKGGAGPEEIKTLNTRWRS